MTIKLVRTNEVSREFLVACEQTIVGTRKDENGNAEDILLSPTRRQWSKWQQGRGLAHKTATQRKES